jgi:group I intron endonuclease
LRAYGAQGICLFGAGLPRRLFSSYSLIDGDGFSLYSSEWFMHRLGMAYKPAQVIPYSSFNDLKELKKIGGIYAIYCKTEDKVYVGSAVAFYKRLNEHFNVPASSSKNLQAAMLKHRKEDFIILILDILGSSAPLRGAKAAARQGSQEFSLKPLGALPGLPKINVTLSMLEAAENSYLHRLDPAFLYNIKLEAYSFFGFTHSEKTKKAMGENKLGDKNPFYGRKHTLEAIAAMAEMKEGEKNPFFGSKHTPETKAVMSDKKIGANHPLAKSIIFTNVFSGEIISFNTIKAGAAHFNRSPKTITDYAYSGKLFNKEWKILIEKPTPNLQHPYSTPP